MSMYSVVSSRTRRNRGDTEITFIDLSEMRSEEILMSLVEISRENAYIVLESDYIERYLEKNDPELLLGVTKMMAKTPQADTRIRFEQSAMETSGDTQTSADRQRQKSRGDGDNVSMASTVMSFSSSSMRTVDSLGLDAGVNFVMKIEMVEKDCQSFSLEIDKLRNATRAELRNVTAEAEELRLSNQEACDALAEFRDFVMVKGMNPDTKRVPLERCLKFFDKWVIHGNGLIEQMRLRTATLKQEIGAMEKALAIKAELSGILLPVDFEQLEIERRAFMQTFSEKESHLIGLKRVTGNVSLALTTQRKSLEKSKTRLAQIQKRTKVAKSEIERFDDMCDQVDNEIDEWQERKDRLKVRRATYQAPSTMEYLTLRVRLTTLEREVQMRKRQNQIALIKEKNVKAKVRRKQLQDEQRVQEHKRILEQAREMKKKPIATDSEDKPSRASKFGLAEKTIDINAIKLEVNANQGGARKS